MKSNEVRIWFEESEKVLNVHKDPNGDFVIYKGFKITQTEENYLIEDVRFRNIYDKPSEVSLEQFRRFGFIRGCDIISFERDKQRIETYKKKIESLYEKRKKFKKLISKDKRLNTKRIRNINVHIDEYVDLIFLYQTRVEQFNNKYNKNE